MNLDPDRPLNALDAVAQVATETERTAKRRDRALVVLGLALMALALGAIFIGVQVLRNTQRGLANREAVRVSCTLIANLVRQSGVPTDEEIRHPSAQMQLTSLRLRAIRRGMTPAMRFEERRLQRLIDRYAGRVQVPDCEKITRNPEFVTTFPLP